MMKSKINCSALKKGTVVLESADIYYRTADMSTPTLHDINLTIPAGSFIGITGKVGSGKSGLLSAILEEAPYYSGLIKKNGTIGYVEQEPMLFCGTVRENVLFGSEFDQDRYVRALELSCLDVDIKLLVQGDETQVGERGTTLSGGQRARIAFARALYFDADIYLFDDPISAVDSKVAERLMNTI